MELRTRLIAALLSVLTVFLIGAVGFAIIEHKPLLVAAYWMAATQATVGYGDEVPLSDVGRGWSILMIVLGVISAAVAVSFLQATIVSGELRRVMGRRKLLSKIKQLSGHTIVCGYGRMGRLIAAQLRQHGRTLVVVETDPTVTSEIEEAGLVYILGDATEEETLIQAGIHRAAGLIAVLPHDAENVFVTLTARCLRNDLQIIARAEQLESETKLHRAGANRVVCPHVAGAVRIANTLIRPNVTDFFEVAAKGVDLEMDEIIVSPDADMCGKTLRESQLRQTIGVMVVAIMRPDGSAVFSPGPDELLSAGDTLIVIGQAGASTKLDRIL